jgi:hypothetical protein
VEYRFFHFVLIWGSLTTPTSPAFAAILTAQLFPLTGEIRLQASTPVSFVYYSISSSSGALNSSGNIWKSITNNYDAPTGPTPGNGFIDPIGQWIKLSATRNQLAEGSLGAVGGSLAAQRSVSLGAIWNPHAVSFPDLVFDIRDQNGQPFGLSLQLTLDGDFTGGRTVDQFDYGLWRQYFGSTTILLPDGNINGRVDAADYVVWRNNLNKTLPLPPYGSGSGVTEISTNVASVPEPTSVLQLVAAMMLIAFRQLSRPRQASN